MLGPAFDALCAEVERDRLRRLWPNPHRLEQAMRLAPGDRSGLAVCSALLRGEQVPADRLDQEWLARYGRRKR